MARDNGSDRPVKGKDEILNKGSSDQKDICPVNKITHDAIQGIIPDFTTELRLFKEELREEMKAMRSELQHIRLDIGQLRDSIKSCHDRLDGMEARIFTLETSSRNDTQGNMHLEEVVATLRQELNERDQDLISNDIEIANLPETSGENLIHTIQLIGTKLGIAIEASDIVNVQRVGRRHINATSPMGPNDNRPRYVAVRLTRRCLRDELLRSARVRRGVTTADLGLPGSPTRFYVNERLTKMNRLLFHQTRKAAQRDGWKFVWTKQGRIFARQRLGDPAFSIHTEKDIFRIFGEDKDNKD